MRKDIIIGDIVETCSLMPGIVMSIKGDDIYVRMLDIDEYNSGNPDSFANCSLSHCGIVKLTAKEALIRLFLGKESLGELWRKSSSYEEYLKMINTEYNLMTYHNGD